MATHYSTRERLWLPNIVPSVSASSKKSRTVISRSPQAYINQGQESAREGWASSGGSSRFFRDATPRHHRVLNKMRSTSDWALEGTRRQWKMGRDLTISTYPSSNQTAAFCFVPVVVFMSPSNAALWGELGYEIMWPWPKSTGYFHFAK